MTRIPFTETSLHLLNPLKTSSVFIEKEMLHFPPATVPFEYLFYLRNTVKMGTHLAYS